MATMLAFLTTDAAVTDTDLEEALRQAVQESFNMMSIDMDTSTSDMAIIMTNGSVAASKVQFQEALSFVCKELAKMVAKDGEGATKLIVAQAKAAASLSDAQKVAKSIVTSNLIKTALYGNDPNWGRLMMAIGNSGAAHMLEQKIDIWINDTLIVQSGKAAASYNATELRDLLEDHEEIVICISLNQGNFSAEAYGSDMSEEYVKINAEYTS